MPFSSLFPLLQKTLKNSSAIRAGTEFPYRQLLSLQWVREKTHWKLNYLPRTINVFTVPPPKCRGPRECRLWRLHRKHKIYWLWNLQRGKIKWKRFQPGKIIASLHALCPCEVAVVVCRALVTRLFCFSTRSASLVLFLVFGLCLCIIRTWC